MLEVSVGAPVDVKQAGAKQSMNAHMAENRRSAADNRQMTCADRHRYVHCCWTELGDGEEQSSPHPERLMTRTRDERREKCQEE